MQRNFSMENFIFGENIIMDPIIIIGTGLAGYGLAKAFRQIDKTTPMTLITHDDGYFYSKPMLSNALIKNKEAKELITTTVEENITQLNVHYLTKTHVLTINPKEKIITTSKEERQPYSKLVLAWGASPITLPILEQCASAFSINHFEDYSRFREHLNRKMHVAVLGAGLIGCEFANDLAHSGHEVTMITPARYPLDTLIPENIGLNLQKALSELNVQWNLGSIVSAITEEDSPTITLTNGKILKADAILSAIGIRPKTDLAKESGIIINRGIVTNSFLETNHPDIYALGDCAEVNGYVLPYIAPIAQCTKALAKTLAGEKTAVNYPPMPITVKTSCYPLSILPPPLTIQGEWQSNEDDKGICAQFRDSENQLWGFILTQARIMERFALIQQMPHLF